MIDLLLNFKLEISIIGLIILSSLLGITFTHLLIARRNDILGFYGSFLSRISLTRPKLAKLIGGCSRCFATWIFIVHYLFIFGFDYYLFYGAILTVIVADQISKLLKYG